MTQPRALLLAIIATLCLSAMACERSQTVTTESSTAISDAVIETFSYSVPSDTGTPTETAPRIVPPLQSRLTHTDPLNLPATDIVIAGSDTLGPVTEQMYEAFYTDGFSGNVRMSQSSTTDGMAALCAKSEVDIVNASRPMNARELAVCRENGVTPLTLTVGYDPLVFLTHKSNDWLTGLKRADLPKLFRSPSWQALDAALPSQTMTFHMPYRYSGSMYAMSDFVYGNAEATTLREIDNAIYHSDELELTRGLASDPNGIGFASLGRLAKMNNPAVNVLPLDGYAPIRDGDAYPIKRSLFLLTSEEALQKPGVQVFLAYYLNHAPDELPSLGFAPLGETGARAQQQVLLTAIKSGNAETDFVSE